ncbi:MAG: Re/Si-specific NAD(P)(+) transhydrogenase subunit alpha [Phycisphaerales bacterium]|nr:Re/Si-specific NAD(P)(+) transhydrogenase subunit alpha [Phycisphaerales bacterium]
MKIAVPKEVAPGETRVALVPQDVARLVKAGISVAVESGAGHAAGCADSDYTAKGATIETGVEPLLASVDVVVKVFAPIQHPTAGRHEVELLREGSALIAHLSALGGLEDMGLLDRLNGRRISALSLDCVPRITRAQSMDVLSSQATISGYKAVLMAADALPKMLPMLMTAAGTLAAARVFVLGAGVAGLQAIATAKRLGAVVEAFDTRAAVKEQVQSLGARFVELELGHGDAQDKGGYAKALSADQHQKEQELLARHVKDADVVIATALVPGRKAPVLVTEDMVKSMRRGSVVVDLAAERGGNCACTEPGQVTVKHGVTICGTLNLPALLPVHASQMFSRNVSTLVLDLHKDGALRLDRSDEVVAGALITHNGETVHEATRKRHAAPVGAS